MINRAGLGIACALGAAAMYGMVPNFVRAAYINGIPPIESTFFRTSIIALAFAILGVIQGESFRVPKAARASFAAQSLATLVVSVCYLASVQFIPVGLAVIIFFLFPILIMLAAPIVEGHGPGLIRTIIAVIAFAGLAIAVGPSFESLDFRGIILAMAAAVGGAGQFFSGRSISRYMKPSVFGSLVHLAIWPPVLLVALYAGGGKLQIFHGGTATVTGLVFIVGVAVVYVVAYLIQMLSLRFANASVVAPFYNLEPITTTAIAAAILGERMQMNQYAGGGIVLAALVTSNFIGMRKSSSS
jgi:drug/metabolite transporter (DMT)-like permease